MRPVADPDPPAASPSRATFPSAVALELEPKEEPADAAVILLILGLALLGFSALSTLFGLLLGPMGFGIGFALSFLGLALLPSATRFSGAKAAVGLSILAVAGAILWGAAASEFGASQSPCPNIPCDYSWLVPYANAVNFGMVGVLASIVLLSAPLPARTHEVVRRKALHCSACGTLYALDSGKFCVNDDTPLRAIELTPVRRRRRRGTVVNLRRDFLPWLVWMAGISLAVGFTLSFVNTHITWWTATNSVLATGVLAAVVAVAWVVCASLTVREDLAAPP